MLGAKFKKPLNIVIEKYFIVKINGYKAEAIFLSLHRVQY